MLAETAGKRYTVRARVAVTVMVTKGVGPGPAVGVQFHVRAEHPVRPARLELVEPEAWLVDVVL